MYIIISLIGYVLLGIVFILDKYILTGRAQEPSVYAFYSGVFMLLALALLPFGGGLLYSSFDWFVAISSGFLFGIGLWTVYIAVKGGEASHMFPFNGAMVTVFTFLFARLFLQEELSQLHMVGIVILVLSSMLLSYQKTEKKVKSNYIFIFAIISGIAFALSHILAKYIYMNYSFITGFVWTRSSTALFALVLLLVPAVRHSLIWKKGTSKEKRIKNKNSVFIVTINKLLAVIAIVFIQYAIAIGSPSIVTALAGVQFAFMFILILFFTYVLPKVFFEYFTRRELLIQSLGIILVIVGSAMFLTI